MHFLRNYVQELHGLDQELESGREHPCYAHQNQPPQMALETLRSHLLAIALLQVFKALRVLGPKAVMVNRSLPHKLDGGSNQRRDQHHPCAASTPPVDLWVMQRHNLFHDPELDAVIPEIKWHT